MAENEVKYKIQVSTSGSAEVDKTKTATDKLNRSVSDASSAFNKLAKAATAAFAIHKVIGFVNKCTEAYNVQLMAETKLEQVMRNTMGATNEQIQSIKDLTAAQQQLGVIGDEVQLGGAQELSTYLTKTETLKRLIPVMNDMVAQQYGINATQEQSVGIASMMGKVMDGQIGALSRYGYKFDDAQEKILKFGTEEQRAAVLADVISASVGGMNAALAQTDAGRMKQLANTMGDIDELFGKAITSIRVALLPAFEWISEKLQKLTDWISANQETIISVVQKVASIVVVALEFVGNALDCLFGLFGKLAKAIKDENPVFVALSILLLSIGSYMLFVEARTIAMTVATKAVTFATALWEGAQWLLNAALTANPIGLIIAAIVALIAVIAYVIYKTEGWGKTWDNVVQFASTLWQKFKSDMEWQWLHIQDSFLTGIETIEEGWYKIQSLWDKDAASAGLANMQQQQNERAKELAAAYNKSEELSEKLANMNVIELTWNKEKKLSDIIGKINGELGISEPAIPGIANGGLGSNSKVPGGVSKGAESIATGGTRSTNITIDIGKLIETVNIHAQEFREGVEEMKDCLIEELTRALNIAQSGVR